MHYFIILSHPTVSVIIRGSAFGDSLPEIIITGDYLAKTPTYCCMCAAFLAVRYYRHLSPSATIAIHGGG